MLENVVARARRRIRPSTAPSGFGFLPMKGFEVARHVGAVAHLDHLRCGAVAESAVYPRATTPIYFSSGHLDALFLRPPNVSRLRRFSVASGFSRTALGPPEGGRYILGPPHTAH